MVSDILNEQRNENLSDFRSACPNVDKMIHYMDCFMTLVSERLLTYHVGAFEENEVYRLKLIVSFIRTHYVISDLVKCSENIEAVVLLRKQLELLCRFKELEKQPSVSLHGKTPNIKHIENCGVLYGVLSEISHSSKEETLSLLGEYVSDDAVSYSLLPVFTKHTITTFSNYVSLFCKFAAEMLIYQGNNIKGYTSDEDMDIINNLIEEGCRSNIPFFEQWKEDKE